MNHQGELGKWNANMQFSYIHIHVIKVRRSILVVRRLAVLSYLSIRFRSIHQALISPYSFSSMPPLDRPRKFSPYIQRFYLLSRKIFDRSQLASIKINFENEYIYISIALKWKQHCGNVSLMGKMIYDVGGNRLEITVDDR